MEFRILGAVEALHDGVPVTLDGAKQKTALVALLLAKEHIVPDDRLSTLLWGDNPPVTSSAQIYTYVSRLRKYLGDEVVIMRKPPGYVMKIGYSELDYDRFERLTKAGMKELTSARNLEAAEHFREALGLWQGPPLSNVTEFLAEAEVPRLEEARMTTLESRIEADLAVGDPAQLVSELTGLVTDYPLREQLCRQLMIALYRSGRQADALWVFHDARRLLAEELGVDPGTALLKTHQAILTNDPSLGVPNERRRLTVAEQPSVRPALLPPNVVDYTGRAAQLDRLGGLLSASGLSAPAVFQIAGMAGVGKSALAIRAAYSRLKAFPDGQLYANLAEPEGRPADPCTVLMSFLRSLGIPDSSIPDGIEDRVRLYRSRLAGRRMLVLLDNVLDATQVPPLLPGGQECRTLITGRRDLVALPGLHRTALGVLEEDEAIAMLSRIIGEDRVTAEDVHALRIVRLCGALPLALRIAGARLCAKPHWTLERLSRQLAPRDRRLDRLSLGGMDVRDSLWASYQELDEEQRRAFQRLSEIACSGFTASLAGDLLDLTEETAEEVVESLVDARLLDCDTCDGMPRYRMNELVRLFGHEQCHVQPRDEGNVPQLVAVVG